MTEPPTAALTDSDITRLQTLLDGLPPPLQPMDISALDGYLCGVLLQPQRVGAGRWLPQVTDIDARPAPSGPALEELQALLRRRHAELDAAIESRQWFDPWIFPSDPEGDDETDEAMNPAQGVLPWVAGFAAAMEVFPELMALEDEELVEPLAILFMHFDPADLEDADALIAVIETLEPPKDLAEAVQDLVRALMLIADVTRPRKVAPRPTAPPRRTGPAGRRTASAGNRPGPATASPHKPRKTR